MYRELSRWGLALVLIVGLLVRVGFVSIMWGDIAPGGTLKDPDDYGRLALNLVRELTFGYPVKVKDSSASEASNGTAGSQRSGKSSQSGADKKADAKALPTAFRPPLYPSLLTLAVLPDLAKGTPISQARLDAFVVVGIHILMGLITIGLVYYIAWRLDYRCAWIPALAVAADPILLFWSGEMMTETLITMLAVWAWALYLMLVRPIVGEVGRRVMGVRMSLRVSLLLGLVLGLAVLTRPTMLPWAVLMIASLSFRGSDAGNRVSMITAALIVMSLINAAWMLRNKQQMGKPIWTTTHGGYTLLLANNPLIYKHFKANGPDRDWDAEEFHKHWAMRRASDSDPLDPKFWTVELPPGPAKDTDIDELKDDRLAQEAAIATIKGDPQTFALSCLYRAGWLWAPYPAELGKHQSPVADVSQSGDSEQPVSANNQATKPNESKPIQEVILSTVKQAGVKKLGIGIWYGVWFVMAFVGVLWLREALASRVWLMPILLVLTLTAIHMIYWSNMRMRAPMMPVVYMLACWPLLRTRIPSRM